MDISETKSKLNFLLAKKGLPRLNLSSIPPQETIQTGLNEIERLIESIPRGEITEIFGSISSGRTSLLFSLLHQITVKKEEFACIVDPGETFDPISANSANVDLSKVLWIRTTPNIQTVLKITDLLLNTRGFGLIGIDCTEISIKDIQNISVPVWFRLQRAVKDTPTILLFLFQVAGIKICASFSIQLRLSRVNWSPNMLCGIQASAEIIRPKIGHLNQLTDKPLHCRIGSQYTYTLFHQNT